MRKKRIFLTDTQRMEVCRLYSEQGILSTELTNIFNVGKTTILNCLKENNIEVKRVKINPGDKFGRWTVIKEVEKRGNVRYFLCECSCIRKTQREVALGGLRNKKSLSCGCLTKEVASGLSKERSVDYTGQIFGRLTVISEVERGDLSKQRRVIGQCSCNGNTDEYQLNHLKNGTIKDCGCSRRERINDRWNLLIGKVFGRLKILSIHEKINGKYKVALAQCLNDGNIGIYYIDSILCGCTSSCGCYNKERTAQNTYQVKDYEEKHPFFCQVEDIMDNPNGYGILVRCKKCDKWYKPTKGQLNARINALENPASLGSENNLYCSPECKNSCPLYNAKGDPLAIKEINDNTPTSYELNIWREENLQRQRDVYGYNFCTINENHPKDDLVCHHIHPKKLEPGLALDPENCIIVCRECHDELHKGGCSFGALAGIKCNIKGKDKNC